MNTIMMNYKRYLLVFIVVIVVAIRIYDWVNERPFYYKSINGKISRVEYGAGKYKAYFYLDDSTEVIPGSSIINHQIGDSVSKKVNTYAVDYFRKDESGRYRKLNIIPTEESTQKLVFE